MYFFFIIYNKSYLCEHFYNYNTQLEWFLKKMKPTQKTLNT